MLVALQISSSTIELFLVIIAKVKMASRQTDDVTHLEKRRASYRKHYWNHREEILEKLRQKREPNTRRHGEIDDETRARQLREREHQYYRAHQQKLKLMKEKAEAYDELMAKMKREAEEKEEAKPKEVPPENQSDDSSRDGSSGGSTTSDAST